MVASVVNVLRMVIVVIMMMVTVVIVLRSMFEWLEGLQTALCAVFLFRQLCWCAGSLLYCKSGFHKDSAKFQTACSRGEERNTGKYHPRLSPEAAKQSPLAAIVYAYNLASSISSSQKIHQVGGFRQRSGFWALLTSLDRSA